MMILKVANYDSILYIHTNYELDIFKFLGKKSNLKFYLDYVQGTWKISNNHDLYESKEIIESRGQYQVLQTR